MSALRGRIGFPSLHRIQEEVRAVTGRHPPAQVRRSTARASYRPPSTAAGGPR